MATVDTEWDREVARPLLQEQNEQEKAYHEYNQSELEFRGELGKLKILELDKHLEIHQVNKKGRKADKINCISADVLRNNQRRVIEEAMEQMVDGEESGDSNGSDEDLVIKEIGTESSTSSEVESDTPEVEHLPLIVKTRYGRYVGHWNLFKLT